MNVDWGFPEVFSFLQAQPQPIYLVGGAVRNALLGLTSHDLDFAVAGKAYPLARRLADHLKADVFQLDDVNDTARVLLTTPDGSRFRLDFATLRAASLEGDLRARDYTINAIALDVHDLSAMIDPLHGAQDLKDHVLRACSDASLQDDPLRVLRGVRLAVQHNLLVEPHTRQLLHQAAPLLCRVSVERWRDELFRILEGPRPAQAVRVLQQLDALTVILPELIELQGVQQTAPHVLDVWEHTLAAVGRLEQLWAVLVDGLPRPEADLMISLADMRLGRFSAGLRQHFAAPLVPERSLRGLVFLAALYHDVDKPAVRSVDELGKVHFYRHEKTGAGRAAERARALALSVAEVHRLSGIVHNHMRIHHMARHNRSPDRRAIYRYYQAADVAGVDICLFTLADTWATFGPTLTQERWLTEVDICRTLLEAWFEKPEEAVRPVRLIGGADLLTEFDLQPGPLIGDLLYAVEDAQAAGEIATRPEALTYARNWIKLYGDLEEGV